MQIFKSKEGTIKIQYEEGYSAVIIPTQNEKNTLCLSSQVGCAIGCTFCYTGKFKRNLSKDEIMQQVQDAQEILESKRITSVVFMGMGEPMLNFKEVEKAIHEMHEKIPLSYKKITLSTSGIHVDKLMNVPYLVALSLHAPFEDKRKKMIPHSLTLPKLLEFIQVFSEKHKEGIMIEYALIQNINDRPEDLDELLKLPFPKNTNFNLIEYNDFKEFKKTDKETLQKFKEELRQKGFKCFIRESRGKDIQAACGMLEY